MTTGDLVIVMLPGVQQFVAQSRSTGDAAASSRIVSRLADGMRAAVPLDTKGTEIVFPAPVETPGRVNANDSSSLPNRVVFRVAAGTGTQAAKLVAAAAGRMWQTICGDALRDTGTESALQRLVDESVGFPAPRWVVVPATVGGYDQQWRRAMKAVEGRKRIRDFPLYDQRAGERRLRVCSLTARWAADPTSPMRRVARTRPGEALSAPALVKRAYAQRLAPRGGHPSTASVATATFRQSVIEAFGQNPRLSAAVDRLRDAVTALGTLGVTIGSGWLPGLGRHDDLVTRWLSEAEGAWLLPQTWEPGTLARQEGVDAAILGAVCAEGRSAANALVKSAGDMGIRPPSSYLAVVVQDADRMGRNLSRLPAAIGGDLRSWHSMVSTALVTAAGRQRDRLQREDLLGWTVYSGGDDLLGFVPVTTALDAARALNTTFGEMMSAALPGGTASTAVVFFHMSWPLQSALSAARELLDEAKKAARPGLGVAALRRGGERVRLARAWLADPPAARGTDAVSCLQTLVTAMRHGLSGRLAASLERDRELIDTLSDDWLRRELRRLVRRHSTRAASDIQPASAVVRVDDSGLDAAADALLALCGRDERPRRFGEVAVLARFIASEGW